MGWVQRRRDHGGLIFIDLRSKWIVQVVLSPDFHKESFQKGESIRGEFVLAVKVWSHPAPEGTINPT